MRLSTQIEPGIEAKYENGIVELTVDGHEIEVYIHEDGIKNLHEFLIAGQAIGLNKSNHVKLP